MSDNIPLEIQVEIIKRLSHVQSLLRLRSVSKQWKSLIDCSEFITHHHNLVNQTQPHHMLVSYCVNLEDKVVSIVDDDRFPDNKFYPTIPHTVKLLIRPVMLGCSHGLVCAYGILGNENNKMIVIWNPSIRKSVGITLRSGFLALGFGVCPKTMDPKIIKITVDKKAEVFTLSTGAWRTISMNPSPRLESIGFHPKQVVLNGVVHWTATYCSGRIITFDVTSEEFGEVDLPDGVSGIVFLFIHKPKESLAFFNDNEETHVCDVWVMIENDGSKSSFAKLFTFAHDNSVFYILEGFRMNGQLIMMEGHIPNGDDYDAHIRDTLKVYDTSLKHMNDIEIDVDAIYDSMFRMTSYTESLLMLNQPHSIF